MPSSVDRSHALPDGTPGYETSDANARGVFAFLIGLGVVVLLVVLACWGIFHVYGWMFAHQAPASPFAEGRQIPTGPNLQVNPEEDFQHYMQREQQELQTYGWQNRQTGTVRVPIDRAMDMLLQKGVPVAPAPTLPAPQKTQPPSQQSSQQKGLAP